MKKCIKTDKRGYFLDKKLKIKFLIDKLNLIIDQSIKNKEYERTMSAIDACANILYQWNQVYVYDNLENKINILANNLVKNIFDEQNTQKKVVLFYDGFGSNTRGLALIYLKAIASLGYHLVYLRPETKDLPTEICKNLKGFNVTWETFTRKKHLSKLNDINNVFVKYKPKAAFFYSYPNDVAGASVFCAYKNIIKRFQINLTDHAYWLGINAFDYCIEFRDYGAFVSNKYRKIEKEKLIKLPFYPYFDKNILFQGFPFDVKNKKIIFSGGNLYKTLGDANNTYYKIVNSILSKHLDVIFLYAGNGDATELNKLMKIYPNRVYHIKERKDLYQLMTHITLYLNTYPILGGLMTQYAAVAGKIPITLIRKNDVFDGFLINQEKIGIEYTNIDELLKDVDKLLEDDNYRHDREKKLIGSVISENDFKEAVQDIILKNSTKYDISYKEYNNEIFLKGYVKRANYNNIAFSSIATFSNRILLKDFPEIFVKKFFYKLPKVPKKIIEKLRS